MQVLVSPADNWLMVPGAAGGEGLLAEEVDSRVSPPNSSSLIGSKAAKAVAEPEEPPSRGLSLQDPAAWAAARHGTRAPVSQRW